MYRKIKQIFEDNWRRQTIIVITFTCLLINALSITLYFKNEQVNNSKNWVIHSYEVLRQSRLVVSYLQDMEIGQRGYFLSSKPEFLEPYETARKKIVVETEGLNKLVSDNKYQSDKAAAFEKEIIAHEKLLDDQIVKFGQKQHSITVRDLQESSNSLNSIRDQIRVFQLAERDLLFNREAMEKQRRNEYTNTIIFGSILAVLALIAANSFIFYQTVRRKTAEKELKRSEEIYTLVTQGINEGIFDYDIANGRVFYSKGFKQMIGYTDEEFPNSLEAMNEHMHPEDFKGTWETINAFINSDQTIYRNYFRIRHKQGHYIWVMSRGVGIREKNGKLSRLIGTHTDITEQKEVEEYLKRLNNDLENFTYVTSHDLRSPLVNLKGFASEMNISLNELRELMKAALPKTSKYAPAITTIVEADLPEAVLYIKTSVERLDQLTTAILDLSRIGKREIKIEEINTEEMVKKILATMAYEINNNHIQVKVGELPEIVSDRISIQQIFSNIIENSIKYLDADRKGEISIKGSVFPSEIQFIIADNGRGIAEGDKERIFDMFKRARNVQEVRGVGMGMAFVKATIQRLGGKIWFESTLGVGTKFIFTIPNRVRRDVYYE